MTSDWQLNESVHRMRLFNRCFTRVNSQGLLLMIYLFIFSIPRGWLISVSSHINFYSLLLHIWGSKYCEPQQNLRCNFGPIDPFKNNYNSKTNWHNLKENKLSLETFESFWSSLLLDKVLSLGNHIFSEQEERDQKPSDFKQLLVFRMRHFVRKPVDQFLSLNASWILLLVLLYSILVSFRKPSLQLFTIAYWQWKKVQKSLTIPERLLSYFYSS